METDCVVADALPASDGDAGEVFRAVPAVLVAEDVAFALRLSAGRGGAEFFKREIGLAAVIPSDGDFVADELDVLRRFQFSNGRGFK